MFMKADRISSLFCLAMGLLIIYGSVQLGLGRVQKPGPGFIPFLTGSFICLMALVVFFSSFIKGKGYQAEISTIWEGARWHRPLIIVFLLTLYALALERIGFLLTTFIILGIIFKWVEKMSWLSTIILSLLFSGGAFLLFNNILKAFLPKGILTF